MLKIPWGISDTEWQNSHSFVHSSYLLPDDSAGRIARELWWTSQEFSPAGIITTMALHAHISPWGWTIGPLVAAVLRHKSHHIGIIIRSINAYKIMSRTRSNTEPLKVRPPTMDLLLAFVSFIETTYSHISILAREISSFLQLVIDDLASKSPGLYSIPC